MGAIGSDEALAWAVSTFLGDGRSAAYATLREYYDGGESRRFASPKYAAVANRIMADLVYNRVAGVVEAHADRLQVLGFGSDRKGEVAHAAAELWDVNQMAVRADEVHRDAALYGDAYVLVWPESAAAGDLTPRFWPQRPQAIRVRYDEDRPDVVGLAAKAWQTGEQRFRLNLYYPDRVEKWVSQPAASGTLPREREFWAPWREEGEAWPLANPWGVAPVIPFHTNSGVNEYGRSEVIDVLPVQDALNRVVGDLLLASELAGFPQKVILGLDADDPTVFEGLRRLEGGLSRIITVGSGVGGEAPTIAEFTAANLEQLIAEVELLDLMVSRVSRVPVHYLRAEGQFPSGEALRMAEAPFIRKLEDRAACYGVAWAKAMTLALRMGGMADPGRVRTVWAPVAPMSERERWELIGTQVAAGVPLAVCLEWAGLDPGVVASVGEGAGGG